MKQLPKKKPGKAANQPAAYIVLEVARRLRVSDMHVTGLIESGELHAFNIGTGSRNHWRISPESLQQYRDRRSSLRVEGRR